MCGCSPFTANLGQSGTNRSASGRETEAANFDWWQADATWIVDHTPNNDTNVVFFDFLPHLKANLRRRNTGSEQTAVHQPIQKKILGER